MRGRVDMSEGFPRPPAGTITSNLIQEFAHGLGLSRLFQIKERTPAPTFGSEVVPVVLIDDQLQSAYPPRQNVHGGTTQGPGAPGVSPRWSVVRCRGQFPTPSTEDRLVIHNFRFHNGAAADADLFFFCGFPFASLTTVVSTNMFVSVAAPFPAGLPQSDFSHFVTGEDAAALPVTPSRLTVPPNQTVLIEGPWVIGAGQVMGVRSTGAIATLTSCFFNCTEYPGPGA